MDVDALRRKLKAMRLSAANQQMVDYWLSLSKDGALPERAAFDPSAASDLLRGCGLFDVRPGQSVHCRLAGTVLKLVVGQDVAGRDWLALVPARHRAQRLARYSAVAQGAIGIGRRMMAVSGREPLRTEEVVLPFAGEAQDGTRQVLLHTDWRPQGNAWFGVDAVYAGILADEFHLVPLD